jgi:hypothetical protein
MVLTRLRPLMSLVAGASLLGSAVLVGAQPAVTSGSSATEATPRLVNHFAPTCIGYCKHPTNAGKVFRWGAEAWRQEFEGRGPLNRHWHSNHPNLITQQVGMLTIGATPRSNVVRVRPDNQKAAYGRWEARVRAVELETRHTTFSFNWELVPVGGGRRYHCGAQSILMASYRPDDSRFVRGAVRTLPNREFAFSRRMDLRSRAWHTYAVEVTPKHISWFVDTRVVHTERRPGALSGVTYKPRFRIEGKPGARMNSSRMQMDWVRYYDLHRPNARSIDAPAMTKRRYVDAC